MSNSQVRIENQSWLKPEQVQQLRQAVFQSSPDYLQLRDETIIAVMYDTGLRVSELVSLNTQNVDLDDGVLRLSSEQQKDYPNERTPPPTNIALKDETTTQLCRYISNKWKDTAALFPARSSPRMSENSIRNLVQKLAEEAQIKPYLGNGVERGEPADVSPHTLRHSVAYRMLRREEANIYDVKNRLRHASLQSTDRTYSHFDTV